MHGCPNMLIEEQHGKLDTKSVSRQEIIKELETLGINASSFHQLSINELQDLLKTVMQMVNDSKQRKRNAKRGDKEQTPVLSPVDKKILKTLLSSTGEISSLTFRENSTYRFQPCSAGGKGWRLTFWRHPIPPSLKSWAGGWRCCLSIPKRATR